MCSGLYDSGSVCSVQVVCDAKSAKKDREKINEDRMEMSMPKDIIAQIMPVAI